MRINPWVLFVALGFASSSALACLNDTELPDREREFRSQYQHETLTTSNDSVTNDSLWVMKTTGIALLLSSIGLNWLGHQKSANTDQTEVSDKA